MKNFRIMIAQGDADINTVWSGATKQGESRNWIGTDHVDAVQRLHDRYPFYHGDLFFVRAVGDQDRMVAVGIDKDGRAIRESYGG